MSNKYLIYQYYFSKPGTYNAIDVPFEYYKLSSQSIAAYANKFGHDYIHYDHQIPHSPFYGIFVPLIDRTCEQYDAICFLDSDMLATVDSRDIFEHVSLDKLSFHIMRPLKHGNTGTVVFPRAVYNDFQQHLSNLDKLHAARSKAYGDLDQKIINQFVLPSNYNNLSDDFNWHMTRYDHKERWKKSFIHYHRRNKPMIKTDFEDSRILK